MYGEFEKYDTTGCDLDLLKIQQRARARAGNTTVYKTDNYVPTQQSELKNTRSRQSANGFTKMPKRLPPKQEEVVLKSVAGSATFFLGCDVR